MAWFRLHRRRLRSARQAGRRACRAARRWLWHLSFLRTRQLSCLQGPAPRRSHQSDGAPHRQARQPPASGGRRQQPPLKRDQQHLPGEEREPSPLGGVPASHIPVARRREWGPGVGLHARAGSGGADARRSQRRSARMQCRLGAMQHTQQSIHTPINQLVHRSTGEEAGGHAQQAAPLQPAATAGGPAVAAAPAAAGNACRLQPRRHISIRLGVWPAARLAQRCQAGAGAARRGAVACRGSIGGGAPVGGWRRWRCQQRAFHNWVVDAGAECVGCRQVPVGACAVMRERKSGGGAARR